MLLFVMTCIVILLLYMLLKKNIRINYLQKEMVKERETLQIVLNNANDAIFLYELNEYEKPANFIFVNQQAKNLLGYDEEFPSLSMRDIADPINYERIVDSHEKMVTDKGEHWEGVLFSKNHHPTPVEMSIRTFILNRKKVGLGIARDMTERKQTQEALLESEKRYKQLTELSPNAVVLQMNGKIKYVNRSAFKLFGVEKEEQLLEQNFIEFVDQDSKAFYITRLNQLLDKENAHSLFEEKFKRVDGSLFDGEMSATMFRYQKQPAVLMIIQDITSRKRVESLLKESRERYKSLVEYNNDAILSFNTTGELIDVNAMAEELLGFPREEISHELLLSFNKQEGFDVKEYFQEALIGNPVEFEMNLTHRSGQKLVVESKLVPIIINDQVSGVYVILKDITEEKRKAQLIKETKEQLELFWNHSADALFFINEQGDIEKVNPAYEQMFGWLEAEVTGSAPIGSTIPANLREESKEITKRMKKGETIPYYETQRVHKDGAVVHILASYAPVKDDAGNILGAICFYKNITKQKQAESLLQSSREQLLEFVQNSKASISGKFKDIFAKSKE